MPKNKTHSGMKKRVKVTAQRQAAQRSAPACATTSSTSPRSSPAASSGTTEVSPKPTRRA